MPLDARRVTVDVVGQARLELGQLLGAPVDDAGEVHHLRDPDRPAAAEQALDVSDRERPAR